MVATKRKVFVVGLHRSGTSILSELLKAHPSICGHNVAEMPPELENEGQHVQVTRAAGRQPLKPARIARPHAIAPRDRRCATAFPH
jgi:hypothetical protein